MINLDVGSIWRKWDLHVHAPTSVFANRFGGDTEEAWEKYITAIEQLTDISVLGITDYWSLNGYKKVMEYKDKGRLDNIALILPNVEMRLIPFTRAGRACNFHCIFNPTYVKQLESHFFGKLSFKLGQRTYTCQKEELIALGRAHSNDNQLHENAAYREGCKQFKVSHTYLFELFAGDLDLRKNAFLVVPNSSNDGISGLQEGNDEATRHDVYHDVDAIFDGNPSSRKYFLGLSDSDDSAEIIRKYGRLKPCIHGSDAHSNETLCIPDKGRFTWIKSDCTFDGLKQIIFEPKDRVYIGETKPDTKGTYQVIESLRIESKDFPSDEIPINRNLTTIIGGKSTGKSLLLYHIAKTADSEEVDSRLNEMKKKEDPYGDFKDLKLVLNWATGTTSSLTDAQSENDDSRAHKITYIPQSYLNYIAEYQKDTVDKIIKEVLLQNDETKESHEFFEKNKRDAELSLKLKIGELFLIYEQGHTIADEKKAIGPKDGIEIYIKKLQVEIKNITDKCDFTEEDNSQKEKLERQYLEKNQKIQKLNTDKEKISQLIANIENLVDFGDIEERVRQLSDLSEQTLIAHTNAGKTVLFEYLKTKYNDRANLIPSEINSTEAELKIINDKLDPLRIKASQQSGLEEKQKILLGEREKLQKIDAYNTRIEKLREDYKIAENEILERYKNIHSLYLKLVENLKVAKNNLTDVELDISLSYNKDLFEEGFYNPSIDKRGVLLESVLPKYDPANPDEHFKTIKEWIDKIIKKNYRFNGKISHKDALEKYMGSYFHIDYVIKYQGDEFSKMSTGKSSLVLLKLLVELDDGKHPILLDQPEDDLDNRSIYDDLVQFIRDTKKKRQVIIVTHNPNIVIGTDSEQVIVAHQQGQDKTSSTQKQRFDFAAGAIENNDGDPSSSDVLNKWGIREHICQILEGGEEAFKKRDQRYAIKS